VCGNETKDNLVISNVLVVRITISCFGAKIFGAQQDKKKIMGPK